MLVGREGGRTGARTHGNIGTLILLQVGGEGGRTGARAQRRIGKKKNKNDSNYGLGGGERTGKRTHGRIGTQI